MNPSFVDALQELRTRSALSGRPAEKRSFDRMLRENAIRRLTAGRQGFMPESEPAMGDEIIRGGGGPEMIPPGFSHEGEIGISEPGVEGPLAGSPEAEANEAALGLPNQGGWKGALQSANFIRGIINIPMKAAETVYNVAKPEVLAQARGFDSALQAEEFGLATTPVTNPQTGLPVGFTSEGEAAVEGAMAPGEASGILGAMGATGADAAGGGPGPGGTVLCSELFRQRKLSSYLYRADCKYADTLDDDTLRGYHAWAEPVAKAMSRSWLLTAILEPFIHAWTREMSYRVGYLQEGSRLGRVLSFLGEPICRWIGRSMNNGYESDIY